MLAIISAIAGFASQFLPAILTLFQRRQDNAHELAMFKLRLESAANEHLYRMEEMNAKADIEEAKVIHTPAPSFGVQMLDAAKGSGFGPWATVPAFYLFTLLDFISGMVRPSVTYAVVGFYMVVKYAQWVLLTGPKYEADRWEAISQLWGEVDAQVLFLCLGFWFGQRLYKAVFGGSASSTASGR